MLDMFRESGKVSIQAHVSEAVYPSQSHYVVSAGSKAQQKCRENQSSRYLIAKRLA